MRRRKFITLLGGAAAAWPVAARAQQAALPVVGFMAGSSPAALSQQVAAFREGLKEAGFIEGMNVAVEYRYGEGQLESISGSRVRSGPPSSGRDRRKRRSHRGARRKAGVHDNSESVASPGPSFPPMRRGRGA
jgi:hypothetical protein